MRRSVACVLFTWIASVGAAEALLLEHATAPGDPGSPPATLPKALRDQLGPHGTRPLLLVAAHPQCPCLPATLAELRQVLAQAPDVDVRLLLQLPTTVPTAWRPERIAALEQQWPAACVADRDGALAHALHLATSGHVLVYGTGGELRFSGGITAGRGHVGDNPGSRTLRRVLQGERGPAGHPAVFGCPLRADSTGHERACCNTGPGDRDAPRH